MRLAVTVDTEADSQWEPGAPLTTANVGFWQPFQEICERHGVAPTYLVTTPITENERARELLCSWTTRGAAEVGAHLHPWTTPPFADADGLRRNDAQHAYPCQLPSDLLREKSETLTHQIESAFHARPRSYRAGRFGIDGRLARILSDQGYVVDSSVTPLWSWRDAKGLRGSGGPDFGSHDLDPFMIEGTGPAGLLEIPVTLCATYEVLRRNPLLLRAYRSLPVRAIRKLLLSRYLAPQPIWLTPDPRYRHEDLAAAWDRAQEARCPAAVMMLHSSELMPGGSPFRRDAASVAHLLTQVSAFLEYACRRGGRPGTLTDIATEILSAGGLPAKAL